MTAPVYSMMVGDVMSKMDEMSRGFLAENFQALATYMALPISLISTLCIVLLGYSVATGFVKMSTREFLKLALSIGFVNMFALNWLYFNPYFVGLFLDAASHISNAGANNHYISFPHLTSSNSGINDAIQTVLTECVEVGVYFMQQGGYTNWVPLIIGLIFIIAGSLIVSLAMIEVAIIQFFICLLLSTGPFFIALFLFNETKPAFKAWLSILAGFSFALLFVGVVVGLSMNWMHWAVADLHETTDPDLRLYTIVPLFFAGFLSGILLIGIIPIARSIGGGLSGGSAAGTATRHGVNLASRVYQSFKKIK